MRKSISQLNMLSQKEYSQIVSSFNDTAVDYPKDKCVHTLFEEQVEKTPDKLAVIACDRTLTYKELNEQSNRIAHSLIEKGIHNGDIVAFMLPRRSYLISVMFGILKSGAAYLPIDPDYPQDRIDYMLEDSGAKLCITEDNISELLENCTTTNPNLKMSSESLCYCIYTSGSTGEPKGTVLKHKNLINFCSDNKKNNMQKAIISNCQSVISVGSVVFDIFLFETMLSLLNNIQIVFANETELSDSSKLGNLIVKNNVNGIHCTPAKMELYICNAIFANATKNIKVFMLGGEILCEQLVEKIRQFSNALIYNGYGPSETTMGVSFGEIATENSSISSFKLFQIDVLSRTELGLVMKVFNNTFVDYPKEKCVHTLFEEQVGKTPDKMAVIACDRTLTYKELNEQANRIAHSLIEKGIGNGDIVAFMLPRRSYLLSVMFGILKSGAAYMPIDPDYPQDRIDYMLADSGAKLCITEDNISELLENCTTTNPNLKMSSESLCYCIYTSGSTGKPKGTLLNHTNVVNYCDNNNYNSVAHSIIKESHKTIVSVTTVGFDIFVTESILPLLNNLTIILANEEQAKLQKELNKLIIKHPADVLQTTPTKIKSLIVDKSQLEYLKKLKVVILGGEALDSSVIEQISMITNAEIFNIYGPSEATVWVTNKSIKNMEGK